MVTFLAASAAAPTAVFACDCLENTLPASVDRAAAIVVARVLRGGGILKDPFGQDTFESARWEVLHCWKGALKVTGQFVTVSPQGSCGRAFLRSKDWLLFLREDPPDRTTMDICDLALPIQSATTEVTYLNVRFTNARWQGR